MVKITKLILVLMSLFVTTAANASYMTTVGTKFTSVESLAGKAFAIVNETDGKALYNPNAQNLAYDVYETAFASTTQGYLWKIESLTDNENEAVRGCYLLRALNSKGQEYTFWGNTLPYLNTQDPSGWCCFVLGLTGSNDKPHVLGQDLDYGAVWEIEYVDGEGFTIKSFANKGYFTSANATANSVTPAYFTFCEVAVVEVQDPDPTDPGVAETPEGKMSIITNGTLEGDDVSCFFTKEPDVNNGGTKSATIYEGAGRAGGKGLKIVSHDNPSAAWDTQFWLRFDRSVAQGTSIHIEFDYRASNAATVSSQQHDANCTYVSWQGLNSFQPSLNWKHFSQDFTTADAKVQSIAFNLNETADATEYYFDNFVAYMDKPVEITDWTDIIVNGNMEGESSECFYITEQGVGGPFLAPILEGVGKDDSKGVKVESYNNPANTWDTQFFIRLPYQLPAGTKYKVSFDYKATKAGAFDTQAHMEPSKYIYQECIGTGSFTTSWQTYEKEGAITEQMSTTEKPMQTIAFNLGANKEATKFYFDNIKFEISEAVKNTLTAKPAENPTSYPEAITTMSLVGDFTGGWPVKDEAAGTWDWSMAKAMTQDADDDAVWTYTIENFVAEAKKYEYKVAANSNWNRYVLPNGDNASLTFGTDEYPAGTYNLTFTANVKTHTLTLDAEEIFTLTVAGDNTTLFGTTWDTGNTANDLTKQADGTYSITYENKALTGDVKYKIVKNHAWKNEGGYDWPAEDRVIGISMPGNYDLTIKFDYATKEVSEVMAVYKGITDAGYATYCSPYDLNFVDTGVKAYIAKVEKVEEGNVVKFYEVFNAQAGTGLLLKAAEGSYKLKMESITGEGATDASGNALIGVNEQTVVDKKGIYVLLNGKKGVGFYQTTAESFTVGANTAYIDAIAGARTFIGFDDNTTTAIEGVATVKENNGEIYNLQGQRVVKAQKGLYIINGKKVLVK